MCIKLLLLLLLLLYESAARRLNADGVQIYEAQYVHHDTQSDKIFCRFCLLAYQAIWFI